MSNELDNVTLYATYGVTDSGESPEIEQPQTLGEVVETCKAYRVDAVLRDEPGFTRGWVHADGTWRLQ